MINMTQFTNTVSMNEVVVNGAKFMVTDDVALRIMHIISGIDNTSQTVNVTNVSTVTTKTEVTKTPYKATKDFTPQYEIKEQIATDGTKLFCISRKNGWTKSEKSLMNNSIKALKGIKEIEVSYTDKNGKNRTFKAWGYNTESTAKKHLKELPTIFTVAQLNGEA